MVRPLALIGEVLFRFAFGICILIQLVLWARLAAGIETLFRSDNSFVLGLVIFLLLLGPFLIGAANYFIYHRIIREEYICTEAEKWVAERRAGDNSWIRRRKFLKRWAAWIPTVTVILVCTFLDYTLAFASHVLYPSRGRLIGYEVSIPLAWTYQYTYLNAYRNGVPNYVVASRFRGLWRASSGFYIGRQPIFATSTMDFRTIPNGDPLVRRTNSAIISERTLSFGKDTILCREEVRPNWMATGRYIRCFTPTADFSGYFSGSDEDAAEFYRVIESVKRR